MITSYGMRQTLVPRTFGNKDEMVFLGREISEQRNYGDKVADQIDEEVRSLIEAAYATAKRVISENRGRLEGIAKRLVTEETLEGKVLEALLEGRKPPAKRPPRKKQP